MQNIGCNLHFISFTRQWSTTSLAATHKCAFQPGFLAHLIRNLSESCIKTPLLFTLNILN